MKPIRILLLEPDLWRHFGITHVLRSAPEVEILGEEDYNKILALKKTPEGLNPDVLLLSHILLADFGLSLLTRIEELFPGVKIIVHGYESKIESITDILARGAKGYFLLSSAPKELIQAVNLVSKGLRWGPLESFPSIAERARAQKGDSPVESKGELVTPQETALLKLLAQGMTNKEMANHLGVGEDTVKSHLDRLFKRFKVQTRAQLLSYALNQRLVDPDSLRRKQTS